MNQFFRTLTRLLPDKAFLSLKYRVKFGRRLNWQNPAAYTEKLQWLKLYHHDPRYPALVDKYAVRKFVAERIGAEYLIPLLGVWDSADAIDFDALPAQFVLKCTHDCGSVLFCRDKRTFDAGAARQKLSAAMKQNYYWGEREWPYKHIKPRVIAEQLLHASDGDGLKDYKLFCFDGTVKLILVTSDRYAGSKDVKFDFFDEHFNHLSIQNGHAQAEHTPDCPPCLAEMKALAQKLSSGLPHVRVDLYVIDGKIYFGELTFFHFAGFVRFEPGEWDNILGDWLPLPEPD